MRLSVWCSAIGITHDGLHVPRTNDTWRRRCTYVDGGVVGVPRAHRSNAGKERPLPAITNARVV
jgi:hypothetical protein